MADDAVELAQKRAALIEQIAGERAQIAMHGAALRPAAQMVDRVRDGIYYLRRHPAAWILPAAMLVVLRPRRLLSLGLSAFSMWRFLQQNRRWFRR